MIIDKIFLKRLLGYFILFPLLPFWWLQKLIIREKNIWVFGSWHGQTYSDNSRSLFEYVTENHKKILAIWLSRNKKVISALQENGYKAFHINSIHGIYFSLRAKFIVISSGKSDVNRFFINGGKILHLWHGSPMKKIGLDENIKNTQRKFSNRELDSPLFWRTIPKLFFPFFYEYGVDYLISQSNYFCEYLRTAFNLNANRIIVTGYPRNDRFFLIPQNHQYENQTYIIDESKFNILYLPTFRSSKDFDYLLKNYGFSNERMTQLLNKIDGKLYLKGHIATQNELTMISERIVNIPRDPMLEINTLLNKVDILITDYSGCYFDYLLLDKPVIFAPFDFDDYTKYDRELYDDYDRNLAGYKAKNWIETENEIMRIFNGEDKFADQRLIMNDRFNSFKDSNSSQRIFYFIYPKITL